LSSRRGPLLKKVGKKGETIIAINQGKKKNSLEDEGTRTIRKNHKDS